MKSQNCQIHPCQKWLSMVLSAMMSIRLRHCPIARPNFRRLHKRKVRLPVPLPQRLLQGFCNSYSSPFFRISETVRGRFRTTLILYTILLKNTIVISDNYIKCKTVFFNTLTRRLKSTISTHSSITPSISQKRCKFF